MGNYRPITDIWLLARPKVQYYGAYPSGFLSRARELLGVGPEDSVLHVCSGKIKDYPFRGMGGLDDTLDIDPALGADYVRDVTKEPIPDGYDAILADPPYTEIDAKEYGDGTARWPGATFLLKACLNAIEPGKKVGILHYVFPRPNKTDRLVACVGVLTGFGNRIRCFSVFEKGEEDGKKTSAPPHR